MEGYIKGLKGFQEGFSIYMDKYVNRPKKDKNHLSMIRLAGDYYEEYQKILSETGDNELLSKANQFFLDFQGAVENLDVDKLKALYTELETIITKGEHEIIWEETFAKIFQNDVQQMKLQDEKLKSCQELVDMDIKIYGELRDITKEVLALQHVELIDGKVWAIRENSIQRQEVIEENNDIDDFIKKHGEKLKVVEQVSGKKTLVVNAYAGPGAGKTTACLETVAELKKMGYLVEYVPEYAKELVYDNPALLDGSKKNQLHILAEQVKRLDRFMGRVDIIVTDASILLNPVYLAKPDPDYEQAISGLYRQYENFNFFVRRGEDYVQEGRMENREESIEKDAQIEELLIKNGLFYGSFSHKTVEKLAEKIEITYKRIINDNLEQDKEGAKSNEELYQAKAYLKQTTDVPMVIYGNSPKNLIAKLQSLNQERTEEMKFHSCYIREFNPETNRYENPSRIEVASGKDITPIYLNLPHMEHDKFLKVKEQLKEYGAKYNSKRQAFFITKDVIEANGGIPDKFASYLSLEQKKDIGSKLSHIANKDVTGKKESVRSKLEANKGKIEPIRPYPDKATNEHSR